MSVVAALCMGVLAGVLWHVVERATARVETRRAQRRAIVLRQWRRLMGWYELHGESLNPNTCISISERNDAEVVETLLTIACAVDPRKVGDT